MFVLLTDRHGRPAGPPGVLAGPSQRQQTDILFWKRRSDGVSVSDKQSRTGSQPDVDQTVQKSDDFHSVSPEREHRRRCFRDQTGERLGLDVHRLSAV